MTLGMSPTTHASIDAELKFARRKFPTNRHMLAALTEEVGELAQALIDHERGRQTPDMIRSEAIQVACMAVRIAEEGDESFPFPASVKMSAAHDEEEE